MYKDDIEFFSAILDGEIDILDNGTVVETGKSDAKPEPKPAPEKAQETVVFSGKYKKGEMFQHKGVWYIAVEDGSYLDADELEDGFDVFLSHSGNYTECRVATPEEIRAHDDALTQVREQEKAYTASFKVGQRIRRKTSTSGRYATVLGINVEKCLLNFTNFTNDSGSNWDQAKNFEAV